MPYRGFAFVAKTETSPPTQANATPQCLMGLSLSER